MFNVQLTTTAGLVWAIRAYGLRLLLYSIERTDDADCWARPVSDI